MKVVAGLLPAYSLFILCDCVNNLQTRWAHASQNIKLFGKKYSIILKPQIIYAKFNFKILINDIENDKNCTQTIINQTRRWPNICFHHFDTANMITTALSIIINLIQQVHTALTSIRLCVSVLSHSSPFSQSSQFWHCPPIFVFVYPVAFPSLFPY